MLLRYVDKRCAYIEKSRLCVIVIFQIMFVFKFNRTLGQLGMTLRYSMEHIISMSVITSVIFMAYLALMHTILGPHVESYRFG